MIPPVEAGHILDPQVGETPQPLARTAALPEVQHDRIAGRRDWLRDVLAEHRGLPSADLLALLGGGKVLLNVAPGGQITVTEADGAPSVANVTEIQVPAG